MDRADAPAIEALIAALAGDRRLGALRNGRRARGDRNPVAAAGRRAAGRRSDPAEDRRALARTVSVRQRHSGTPDVGIDEDPDADIVILPELWLAPDDDMKGRYPALLDWIRRRHRTGSTIYSACSGAVLLAATGLLDGREATSHWGYQDLFRTRFPDVRFRPEPNLVFADRTGRIVTAGGTTSWHDLAIHIIARHCSPGEALRIAKVYLLKWHGEGQLPYASLVRRQPHADLVVRRTEDWLAQHFREPHAVAAAVAASGIPERSLKRRFKAATGSTLIGYVQNLRIEEAKRLLETGHGSAEDVAAEAGYENPAFFRRLFKRCTGLTPGEYRRMFRPFATATELPASAELAAA